MKKVVIFIFCLLTTLIFTAASVSADTVETKGKTNASVYLYQEPDTSSKIIEVLSPGCSLSIYSSENDEWCFVKLDTGAVGYLNPSYIVITQKGNTDNLSASASRKPSYLVDTDIFSEVYKNLSIDEKFQILANFYPQDMYWNCAGVPYEDIHEGNCYMMVTNTPCDHEYDGIYNCNDYYGNTSYSYSGYSDSTMQCLGFACMISDFLFGKNADTEFFYDFDQLKIGDHIRLISDEHSMIVTEKYNDHIVVVECNSDYQSCQIQWGREVSKDDLYYYYGDFEFIRRTN